MSEFSGSLADWRRLLDVAESEPYRSVVVPFLRYYESELIESLISGTANDSEVRGRIDTVRMLCRIADVSRQAIEGLERGLTETDTL